MNIVPHMPIAISIVEDHSRTRLSLAQLIDGTPGFKCAGTYPNAEIALKEIPQHPPDVVLMDLHLPNLSGIDCAQKLKQQIPSIKIIMLTIFEEPDKIFKALLSGADGYLLKGRPVLELLQGIQMVCDGGAPMSGEVAAHVVKWFHAQSQRQHSAEAMNLTSREMEILDCLSQGFTYKEISASLNVSVQTINSHIKHIYKKLQVNSRQQAVVKYMGRPMLTFTL